MMYLTLSSAILIAVILWFATGWYLNTRLSRVHSKLDFVNEQLNGLREYLYEIDPQFDDERGELAELSDAVRGNNLSFAGMRHMEIARQKRQQGRRTLSTPFFHRDGADEQ